VVLFAWFFLLAIAVLSFACVWQARLYLVSQGVRKMLDRQGLSDVDFRLVRFSPGRVVLENLRVGAPKAVLAVDWAEVLFTYPEVVRGQIDRIRVRGVRTRLAVDGNRVVSPLQEWLKPLLAAQANRPSADSVELPKRFSVGEISLYDVQVGVASTNGIHVAVVRGNATLLTEPASADCYRFSAHLSAGEHTQAKAEGSLSLATGHASVAGEIKFGDVGALLAQAQLVAPQKVALLPFVSTNCSLAVRGSLSLTNWTDVGSFELTSEVGRGCTLASRRSSEWARFQTLRIEASGTPQDMRCRLSAGIAGIRAGKQLEVSQEEGRLLSVRGTARVVQTSTNRWVSAAVDSDLPGRSLAQILPCVFPLVPRFLIEGGSLHVDADAEQPVQGAWRGEARYRAEARRSAVTLPTGAGRVGAGRLAFSGRLSIRESQPQELQAEVGVEEGYYFGRGFSVRCGGQLSLKAHPPYTSASGNFKGQIGEYSLLPKNGLVVSNGAASFQGEADVTGLVSNPVWHVALRVPEFGIGGQSGAVSWQACAGASSMVDYSATQLAFSSDMWMRDALLIASGGVERVQAGLGRLDASVCVPAFALADSSNAHVRATLHASNGWAQAGERAALQGAQMTVPFDVSLAGKLTFLSGQSLTWRRLDVLGAQVETHGFGLAAEGNTVCLSNGLRVSGSPFGLSLRARVPVNDPQRTEVSVSLPETELTGADALFALVRRIDSQVDVTGRVSAEAKLCFWGTQPVASGRVRVSDAQVRRGGLEVGGLAADIPFECGVSFRTIERPVVTFASAKAGNVRLDNGRVEFQVTPSEVFIDRAEVVWCKGSLHAYSVHLDPKNPKAEVIVYADRIDLGEALMMVMPFKGAAEGVLYGRFPMGIDHKHVKLSTGFLYSLPGQGGKLRLDDPASMRAMLEQAGIAGEIQQPLSKALSDMDFSAIRMELDPKTDGEAVLRMKLNGKSNFKEWPAPVDLNLNLHGPLERLLNLGLDMSRK